MRIIAGDYKGRRLETPEGYDVRPTTDKVKEALFSIINFDIPGAKVLDLFGGTGQLGIEALSRGAKFADFVDHRREAQELVRENLRRTGLESKGEVHCMDYEAFLRSRKTQYDLILLDPPYGENFLEKSLKIITEIDILSNDGIIISERPVGKPLDGDFPGLIAKKDRRYGTVLITKFRKSSEE